MVNCTTETCGRRNGTEYNSTKGKQTPPRMKNEHATTPVTRNTSRSTVSTSTVSGINATN
jgi:hypothetical protein